MHIFFFLCTCVCVVLLSVLLTLLSYKLLEVNFAIEKKILRWTARREASPGIHYMLYPRGFKEKKTRNLGATVAILRWLEHVTQKLLPQRPTGAAGGRRAWGR